jgi:hypothetical protein
MNLCQLPIVVVDCWQLLIGNWRKMLPLLSPHSLMVAALLLWMMPMALLGAIQTWNGAAADDNWIYR